MIYLFCVRTHGIPPIQCIGNVKEISCVLGTGNAHEIVLYTVSGNFQEMYKFHVVRNVHTMNRKCDLSYTASRYTSTLLFNYNLLAS